MSPRREVNDMDSKTRARLRSEAQKIGQTLQVGKGGVTESLVDELKDQLERRRLVKVGLNKSATHESSNDSVAAEIATLTSSQLVEVRGNTAVFWKPGTAPRAPSRR